MRGSLFGIAGFALIVAYPAVLAADKQHDYSNINCADKDFLVALIGELNEMRALKVIGGSIVDITNATTVSRETTKLVCHATLTASDMSISGVTISLFDNSLGQPTFQMEPDGRRSGRRR